MATVLDLQPIVSLNRGQFYQLCQNNPDLNLERDPQGKLVIMSPVGGESGAQEANLIFKVSLWNDQSQLGIVFSSSTIFSLPQGGDRSPDVAWVSRCNWEKLTHAEREGFPPICPDFVIELRSKSDRLKPLQNKMQEYLGSGLRLGWLINPQQKQVEIYRPNQTIQIVNLPATLSGEEVLPGLNISLD
ncbi:Uma2 family endonuclease [Picosynechococcus sp. PCC 11901]|uniref:Uma2 family endonuclease n=1 Tax=Picosynechococcus sp. PCC 11901 TaxID=2579791 RepID=UPI0010FBF2B9|nr:Uma2 family endonuclease [Picosynechococcus sp. PCC 11901]QCS50053.1 Uma2 family endonuclease [Picosynechococcus sp. PCC 11901]